MLSLGHHTSYLLDFIITASPVPCNTISFIVLKLTLLYSAVLFLTGHCSAYWACGPFCVLAERFTTCFLFSVQQIISNDPVIWNNINVCAHFVKTCVWRVVLEGYSLLVRAVLAGISAEYPAKMCLLVQQWFMGRVQPVIVAFDGSLLTFHEFIYFLKAAQLLPNLFQKSTI